MINRTRSTWAISTWASGFIRVRPIRVRPVGFWPIRLRPKKSHRDFFRHRPKSFPSRPPWWAKTKKSVIVCRRRQPEADACTHTRLMPTFGVTAALPTKTSPSKGGCSGVQVFRCSGVQAFRSSGIRSSRCANRIGLILNWPKSFNFLGPPKIGLSRTKSSILDQYWSDRDWCAFLESVFACLVDCLSTRFP